MPSRIPPFTLYFEARFLENYSQLSADPQKAIEKATQLLAHNPRHPSLQVHKANNVTAKYPVEGHPYRKDC